MAEILSGGSRSVGTKPNTESPGLHSSHCKRGRRRRGDGDGPGVAYSPPMLAPGAGVRVVRHSDIGSDRQLPSQLPRDRTILHIAKCVLQLRHGMQPAREARLRIERAEQLGRVAQSFDGQSQAMKAVGVQPIEVTRTSAQFAQAPIDRVCGDRPERRRTGRRSRHERERAAQLRGQRDAARPVQRLPHVRFGTPTTHGRAPHKRGAFGCRSRAGLDEDLPIAGGRQLPPEPAQLVVERPSRFGIDDIATRRQRGSQPGNADA